jgi:hypothetical protein
MDEIKENFDYVLAANPTFGTPIPGMANLYVLRTTSFYPRAPSFRVLYKYDPEEDLNTVELLYIEPVNEIDW